MKFLAIVVVAVAALAAVQANPDPFMNGFFNFLGSAPPQVDPEIVALPANATIPQQQKVLDELFNIFSGLGFSDNSARAVAPANLFGNLMTAYLNTLKNSSALSKSPAAVAVVNAVSTIVKEMDHTKDPIRGLVQETSSMGKAISKSVIETIPSIFNIIGGVLFNKPAQSRSVGDVLVDLTSILNAIVGGLKTVVTRVVKFPGTITGDVFDAVNGVISNVTHISTNKKGLDGGFDLTEQVIGSLAAVVEELMDLMHDITNPLINVFANDFENMIIEVNKEMSKNIKKSLNKLSNGRMAKCADPMTNSMLEFGLGLNEAVTYCLRKEVDTLMKPLESTVHALTGTVATLSNANRVLDMCLSWKVWSCAWNIGPCIGSLMNIGVAYSAIPAQIGTTYATAAMQSRLPVCVAERAIKSMGGAVLTATPIITCMF